MVVGLETKLCDVDLMKFVKIDNDYGLVFRYEDTQDDRENGTINKRYRCIAVCRIDNPKYGMLNFGDFTWCAKYHDELDEDMNLSEIFEIQLYERQDELSLGMLMLTYANKIRKAIENDYKSVAQLNELV